MPVCKGRVRSSEKCRGRGRKYKLLEDGLSDPRNELCDEYKNKYGEYERHGGYREGVTGAAGPVNPEIRLVYPVPAAVLAVLIDDGLA